MADAAFLVSRLPGGGRLAPQPAGGGSAPGSYTITTVAHFECGDPRYAWLNQATVVGVGKQVAAVPVYRLYEIG